MQLDEGFWMRWSDNFGRTFDGGRVVIPVRKNKKLHFLFLSLAYFLQLSSCLIVSYQSFAKYQQHMKYEIYFVFYFIKRFDELQSMRKILGMEKPWELFVVTNPLSLMAWFILHSKRFAGNFNPGLFNFKFQPWTFHPLKSSTPHFETPYFSP